MLRVLIPFLFCLPAEASVLYTFHYDPITVRTNTGTIRTYAADEFAFTVPTFITNDQTIQTPGGELNGFQFSSLRAYFTTSPFPSPPSFVFDAFSGAGPVDEVTALLFYLSDPPNLTGLYTTSLAGRGISNPNGGVGYVYTNGTLSITQIPEPASAALMVLGIGVFCCLRRRWNLH